MMAVGTFKLYHSRLWGYDPLFENKYKLSVDQVLHLEKYGQYKGIYRIMNHPVVSVWIMGDVVSVLVKEKYTSFRVDDGTGCVRCIWWNNEGKPPAEVQQGCLVTVIGKVTEFKDRNHIYITTIEKASDPNQEVYHCLDVIRLRSLYNTPYTIPQSRNRNLVRVLKGSLCAHLQIRPIGLFTLDEMTIECKSNKILTPSEVFDSDVDIDSIVKNALEEMVKDGYFILEKTNPKRYKFLSDEEIIPTILQTFKTKGQGGITVTTLMDILRKDCLHLSVYMPIKRLEEAVEVMVERNLVYPTGEKHEMKKMKYKIVD